jgi:hypothetical protein
MAGSDDSAREIYIRRLEKWKDVLAEIPEELLDETAGWGVCEGGWAGEGGKEQLCQSITLEFISY